jgi:hypothetical protein
METHYLEKELYTLVQADLSIFYQDMAAERRAR